MPILSVQFQNEQQASDGSLVQVPPSSVLVNRGARIQVTVTVAQPIAERLLQQGHSIPAPYSGMALIDTGASVTCIDEAIAQQLQLPVVDTVKIASASQTAIQRNVYPLRIEVVGAPISFDLEQVVGATLGTQGLLLLIGRDILQYCTLFYNGLTGEITLSV